MAFLLSINLAIFVPYNLYLRFEQKENRQRPGLWVY